MICQHHVQNLRQYYSRKSVCAGIYLGVGGRRRLGMTFRTGQLDWSCETEGFYIGAGSRIRSRAWNARIGIILALGFIFYLTDKTLFDKQAFISPSAQLFSMAFFKTKMPALETSPVSSPVLYPSVTSDFEAANLKYAAKFTQSHLPSPPRR